MASQTPSEYAGSSIHSGCGKLLALTRLSGQDSGSEANFQERPTRAGRSAAQRTYLVFQMEL